MAQIGTSWGATTWAVPAWAAGTWKDAGGGGGNVLAQGDLTTAFAAWLKTVPPDVNTKIRDTRATQYSAAQPADLTTLLARFLQNRQ